MTVTPFKTTCAAFGCNRYTRRIGENGVFLCPAHWPTVPKKLRTLTNKAWRRAERYGGQKNWRRVHRLWKKCVDAANREQFGI